MTEVPKWLAGLERNQSAILRQHGVPEEIVDIAQQQLRALVAEERTRESDPGPMPGDRMPDVEPDIEDDRVDDAWWSGWGES